MKRRGFLGFMAGAAVAGPNVAKQSVAQAMQPVDLALNGLSSGVSHAFAPGAMPPVDLKKPDAKVQALKLLTELNSRSPEEHNFHRGAVSVYGLDPDLASYKSFSLSTKMFIQREREYQRLMDRDRKTMLGVLGGWLTDRIRFY